MRANRLSAKSAVFMAMLGFGCGGAGGGGPENTLLFEEPQTVNGYRVWSFVAIDDDDNVKSVGLRVPFQLLQNPPENGTGPAGAFASLRVPAIARERTFFNHIEISWAPQGHPPSLFQVPHFDIHGMAIPEDEVRAIRPPDTVAPEENRLPRGYVYPGVGEAVPEMGVHAVNPAHLEQPFDKVMVLGYWQGKMIFVEPMLTQELLMTKQSFDMPIAKPRVLGRSTLYPTRFRGGYNRLANEYSFIFYSFVQMSE